MLALVALLVAVRVAPAEQLTTQPVPLTLQGMAPAVYRASTHPDSVVAALAATGCQAHRPLAIGGALRGLRSSRAGDYEGADAYWLWANQLDPGYLTPLVASARFHPWHDPKEAAQRLLRSTASWIDDFRGQQLLATNVFVLLLVPLLIAATVSAVLIFARHGRTLHHLYWEHLQLLVPRRAAKWALWGMFALPLLWNSGGLLWAALLLAAGFPQFRPSEKRFAAGFFVLLLVTPLAIGLLRDLIAPANPSHPVSSLYRAGHSGATAETLAELERLAYQYPDEGAIYFTESMIRRQAGDLEGARQALARAESYRPLPKHRFLSARGILAYHEGNNEETIRHFARAVEMAPDRFELRYNLSKAYARASLFLKADREMRQAFALNSGQVRWEERRRLQERTDDLIEERLSTSDLWKVLARTPRPGTFAMPQALSVLFPGQNPALLWPGALLLPPLLWLSHRWHRRLKIHTCCQCGRVVCRRCMKRRERRVFCAECALSAGRWANAQYTQLLLTKLLGRHDRWRDHLLDLARFSVPGLGAILRERSQRGFIQLFLLALCIVWIACDGLPVKPLPWTLLEDRVFPTLLYPAVALGALMVWVIVSETQALHKRTNLKRFLGAARPQSDRRAAA